MQTLDINSHYIADRHLLLTNQHNHRANREVAELCVMRTVQVFSTLAKVIESASNATIDFVGSYPLLLATANTILVNTSYFQDSKDVHLDPRALSGKFARDLEKHGDSGMVWQMRMRTMLRTSVLQFLNISLLYADAMKLMASRMLVALNWDVFGMQMEQLYRTLMKDDSDTERHQAHHPAIRTELCNMYTLVCAASPSPCGAMLVASALLRSSVALVSQ